MKQLFNFIMLVFVNFISFAQWDEASYPGVPLSIGVDSNIWSSGLQAHYTDNNITRKLLQGKRIMGDSLIWGEINRIGTHLVFIRYKKNEYLINAGNLSPTGDIRLPSDWLVTPDEKKWVISYYLDVLHSQDRDAFLIYEQPWINRQTEMIRNAINMGESGLIGEEWHNQFYYAVNPESLIFLNAVIIMGGFDRSAFFIVDIIPMSDGYKITVSGDRSFALPFFNHSIHGIRLPFPLWEERKFFDMIFIPDGDFMDVYLDSFDNHFATFAKVDNIVFEELERLVRTNKVDLSHIIWPHRADGSMEHSPPARKYTEEITIITDNIENQENILETADKNAFIPIWLLIVICSFIIGTLLVLLCVFFKKFNVTCWR